MGSDDHVWLILGLLQLSEEVDDAIQISLSGVILSAAPMAITAPPQPGGSRRIAPCGYFG